MVLTRPRGVGHPSVRRPNDGEQRANLANGPRTAKSIDFAADASRLGSLLLSYIPAVCETRLEQRSGNRAGIQGCYVAWAASVKMIGIGGPSEEAQVALHDVGLS